MCVCVVPVLPAARLPRRLPPLRVLKHVHENGLKLAEDDGGDLEVALQPVHPQPEVLRQVRHVGPLPHLGEELDQTVTETEPSPEVNPRLLGSGSAEATASDLSLEQRRILVSDTQFPSISPFPTVGVEPFLQAAYSEQASQWTTTP